MSETIAAVVFDVKEGSINLKMDDDGAIPKSEQAWLAELMTGDRGPMQSADPVKESVASGLHR